MLNPRKLKRNDVVLPREAGAYEFYGRVWKRHDENHVVVINCGGDVEIFHEDELVLSDYKGCFLWGHEPNNFKGNPVRFSFMPSLRQLKQSARRFNPKLEPWRYRKRG